MCGDVGIFLPVQVVGLVLVEAVKLVVQGLPHGAPVVHVGQDFCALGEGREENNSRHVQPIQLTWNVACKKDHRRLQKSCNSESPKPVYFVYCPVQAEPEVSFARLHANTHCVRPAFVLKGFKSAD